MRKIETIKIDARGRKWSGAYEVEGPEVVVSSAYGSARKTIGRRQPAAVATKLLVGIVTSWPR